MQTSTVKRFSWNADDTLQHKLLWLSAVVLTMGMCLVAPKRLLADELREELLAMKTNVTLSSDASSATDCNHRAAWLKTPSEQVLLNEEYSAARRRKDA